MNSTADVLAGIRACANEIMKLPPAPNVTFRTTPYLSALPRMTLSPNVPVTPEFRAEINAWMLRFFGIEDAILRYTDPDTGDITIFTTERRLEQIKRELGQ